MQYDRKRGIWILRPHAACSASCAKLYILIDKGADMANQLELLRLFLLEFFGMDPETIGTVPITAREKIFPKSGYLNEDQWKHLTNTATCLIKHPPCEQHETFMERRDIENHNQISKKRRLDIRPNSPTQEHQSQYDTNMNEAMIRHNERRSNLNKKKRCTAISKFMSNV
jgi:hypothetical protein